MNRQDIIDAVAFYDGKENFDSSNGYPVNAFTQAHKTAIISAIGRLYDYSSTARGMLENLAASGGINFGYDPLQPGQFVPSQTEWASPFGSDPYIRIDPDVVLYALNKQGERFTMSLDVIIAHEFGHWALSQHDIASWGTDPNATMNQLTYDYYGGNLATEWAVASELVTAGALPSVPSPIRASYQAAYTPSDHRSVYLDSGVSYTLSATVDVVRFGDVMPGTRADVIDVSGRFDSFLIFGFEGNDLITGGNASDYIYGGVGADTLEGLAGDDHLYGGAGDDLLVGGGGNDDLWGGELGETQDIGIDTADFSGGGNPINIIVSSSFTDAVAHVNDGLGGTDALHAIEKIVGTGGRDLLTIQGNIAAGTNLTVDANGGQSPNARDTINASEAGAVAIVIDPTSGTGYVKSVATGGQVNLFGFHTGILGSSYNDQIADQSTGHKNIDGGSGDDTISVGDSATIHGGEGDDQITGSAGNDAIYGGSGFNRLSGGAGSDLLVSSGMEGAANPARRDVLQGGAGADYLIATSAAILTGGPGNDVIDASGGFSPFGGSAKSIIKLSAGDGHDTVYVGSGPFNPFFGSAPEWSVEKIDLTFTSKQGVHFIVDIGFVTEITPARGSPIDTPGSVYFFGNVTILDVDSDTSVTLGVSGHGDYAGYTYDGPSDIKFWHLDLPPIAFSNGYFAGSEWDGTRHKVDIRSGSTAPYSTSEADYQAATAINPNGTSGNDLIIGGIGSDDIAVGDGDDTVEASPGFDRIDGGSGEDTFSVFGSSADFAIDISESGEVFVNRLGMGFSAVPELSTTLTALEHVEFVADSVIIDILTGSARNDVLGAAYNASILIGLAGDDMLVGGDFDDWLQGGAGDDVLTGGSGNDAVSGGSGDDTYNFGLGDGNDTILESSSPEGGGGNDSLVFGAGIAPGDVTVTQAAYGSRLVLTLVGDNSITIDNTTVGNRIEQIRFADGTVWSHADLISWVTAPTSGADIFYGSGDDDTLSGGAGDDSLYGRRGNDTLSGGTGNDWLFGEGGDDTYTFARGGGQDVAEEYGGDSWGGDDTVAFDTGITPSDIMVSRVGSDLVLAILGTSDQITLRYSVSQSDDTIENVSFADGTVWSHDDLLVRAVEDGDTNNFSDAVFSSYDAPIHSANVVGSFEMLHPASFWIDYAII